MASVEQYAAAQGARASAPWGGPERGGGVFRSGSRSEWAGWVAAGLDACDEAVMLWECGHDDPQTQSRVWARLMERGSVLALEGAPWPRGRLSALVALALVELRPRAAPLRAWERLEALRQVGHPIDKRRWSDCWGDRYNALLQEAWGCAGKARWMVGRGA